MYIQRVCIYRESCIGWRVESLVREQHLPSSRNDWSVYSQRQRKLVKRYLEIRCAKLNLMETKGYGMADIPMLQPGRCCNPASRTGSLPPYWRTQRTERAAVRRRAWSVRRLTGWVAGRGADPLSLSVRVCVCEEARGHLGGYAREGETILFWPRMSPRSMLRTAFPW